MKIPTAFALLVLLIVATLPAQVPSTMSYEGRILQNGQPFEGKGYFVFALYEGGNRIWTNKYPASSQLNDPQYAVAEDAMELEVRNGVFSVQLGNAGISNNRPLLLEHFYEANETPKRVRANLRMEVWFSPEPNNPFKKLSPDIEFASVPFAQVATLATTVQNGSVTAEKIAAGAVGTAQLANGQVTTEKIAAGAIGTALIANGTVTTEKTAEKVSSALNPPGTILTYAGAIADTAQLVEPVPGYLLCNGAVIDGTAFSGKFNALRAVLGTAWGNAGDANEETVNLPDLRGAFLRGVSGLRTDRDPDRLNRTNYLASGATGNNVGSYQTDDFKNHQHEFGADDQIEGQGGYTKLGGFGYDATSTLPSSGGVRLRTKNDSTNSGGFETRPKNIYVNYIIKY